MRTQLTIGAATLFGWITDSVGHVFGTLHEIAHAWTGGGANASAGDATPPADSAGDVDRAGALFAEAVRDNSNLEMDWLWLLARVSRTDERRWCALRLLEINPSSEAALLELRRLAAQSRAEGRETCYTEAQPDSA
jgi:hypothetical protein